jgi:hypothetical protein
LETTARKLSFSLPPVPDSARWSFGSLVFFNNLKHCGIVNGPSSFYHAQTSKGTSLAGLDRFRRAKVRGFRGVPKPDCRIGQPPGRLFAVVCSTLVPLLA